MADGWEVKQHRVGAGLTAKGMSLGKEDVSKIVSLINKYELICASSEDETMRGIYTEFIMDLGTLLANVNDD